MKKIKVTVERILEIPDSWEIVKPDFTCDLHLKTENATLLPDLDWMKLDYAIVDSPQWSSLDDSSLYNDLMDMVLGGMVSIENYQE